MLSRRMLPHKGVERYTATIYVLWFKNHPVLSVEFVKTKFLQIGAINLSHTN